MKKIKRPSWANNKNLLVVAVGLALIYSGIRSFKKETSFFELGQEIKVIDSESGEINSYAMEEYLIGVLAAEMPASFETEALRAQAIASRTYAYYKMKESKETYDITNDITTQAHITKAEMKEKWQEDYDLYYDKIKMAIESTKNLILTYEGAIISAYYYAMSNGKTENSQLVFKEDKDYLQSVPSLETEDLKGFKVTTSMPKEEFCEKLSLSCDAGITITNKVLSESGRVLRITINEKTFEGTEVRSLLGIRSTDFNFEILEASINITTKGYGHGVGMSQYGANLMAQEGKNYEEILTHFYTGVKIENITSIN